MNHSSSTENTPTSEGHTYMAENQENGGHESVLAEIRAAHEPEASSWATYLRITLYILLGMTILGFTGRMFWWADFFAHPRLHMAAALGVLAILFLVTFDWLRMVIAIAGIGLNILAVTSAISGHNNIHNALTMPAGSMRIITMNVGNIQPGSAALRGYLETEKADIVVLVEANRRWLPTLDGLNDILPYQKMADHSGSFGLALLSRFPMDKTENGVAGPLSLPTLTAEMETPLGRIAVMSVHPNPPSDGDSARARDLYLAQLAAIVQTTPMPTLMVGDFNATPWSSGFETIRLLPNLQPASLELPPSWPAAMGLAGIPTQHVLLSIPYTKPRNIVFSNLRTGPALPGLSHLPLVADIQIQ